jgi:hypothetical protein
MKSRRWWLVSLALVLVCAFARADPPTPEQKKLLVGKWQPVTEGLTLELTADGHYAAWAASGTLTGTYRWVDDQTIEVTLDAMKAKPGLLGVSVDAAHLAIADPAFRHGKRVTPDEHYKRIK